MSLIRRALRRVVRGRDGGVRARIRHRLASLCSSSHETEGVPPEPPVVVPESVDGLHRLCPVDELQDGEVAEFIVDDVPLAVARVDGSYHAIGNTCPHAGGPLGDGALDGHEVACPWHGWAFDVTSGVCALDPDLVVPVYSIETRDGSVWVDVKAG